MITPQLLLDNGYRQHKDVFKNADWLYQKKVESETGIRYFINVYEYDMSKFIPGADWAFECDLQFGDKEGDIINICFNVSKYRSVEQLEAKVQKIFECIDAVDYE